MNLTQRALLFDGGNRLPRTGRLFYSTHPNGTGVDDGKYVFTTEVTVLLGSWWETPRTMAEILAQTITNQYHVLAHESKGVAVYDPYVVTEATINKARKYFKDDRLINDPEVLSLIPNAYPFTDSKGTERTLYPLQYIETVANLDLSNGSIVGTETVTAKQGTATVTVAAGKLTVGAGTLWSWTLSNGSTYEFGTILTVTTGVCFDTSGNGRHLLFTVANTSSVCSNGMESGSDFLNQKGWTESDGLTYYRDSSGFYLIPADVPIPALADGSGCCAYVEVV